MDYSLVIISDEKFINFLSQILKKLARVANLNFAMNKLTLNERQFFYVIKFTKGSFGSIFELDSPDVLVVSDLFNKELLARFASNLKDSAYIIAESTNYRELSEIFNKKLSHRKIIISENKDLLIGNVMLILSRLLSIRFNTILKVFKTLKDEDTTSLIEAFKLVTRNARV